MARRRKPPRAGAITELPPLKIITQILALQALYYVAALVLFVFAALVSGRPFALDLVLGWEAVRGDTTQGWLMGFLWVLDGGLCMAIAIVLIVIRSKLVPDFALTIHFLHLLVVSLYTRALPTNMMWWLVMFGSSAIASSLGIWGCRYRELKPISFGGIGGGTAASGGESGGEIPSAPPDGDEEQGCSRGRGRGKGRDGAGEYEMVKMNGEVSQRND